MSTAGIWTMICGIALLCVGGAFGMMALGELSTYANAAAAGNMFADVKLNSGLYLLGTAAVGCISGAAFLTVSMGMRKPGA